MGHMFDKIRDQMNNWRWDNRRAFGDQVDRSNLQTISLGKVKRRCEHFSWYSSDDLRAKIEPPSCRLYKPGEFLTVRPLNWDEILDKDDDDEIWADLGIPSGGRSCPSDGNDNDDDEGEEEDTQSVEKGTGKGKWKGKGKGNRKGIVKQTPHQQNVF